MASDDPYTILGVGKGAAEDDIRKAYRKLAKSLHPDLNPGNKGAEERFKKVAQAYDVLGDPAKRKRFDAGEIDAQGQEKPRGYYRHYADRAQAGAGAGPGGSQASPEDLDDILSELFGRGGFSAGGFSGGAEARRRPGRGEDVRYSLTVDLLEAVRGGTRRVTMPDGRSLDIKIPPGTRDGQVLRLAGQGGPGRGGGSSGDALVEVTLAPHPLFARDGDDLRLDLPVTLKEAVQGAKLRVPTPEGAVMAAVPKGSSSGRILRLRGKGVPNGSGGRGDLLVRLMLVLPEGPDEALERFVEGWDGGPDAPRRDLGE